MALVIPIVILLLTTAIFAIYCFKKRADRAEETNRQLVDRLPDFGANDSTRSTHNGNLGGGNSNGAGLNLNGSLHYATPGSTQTLFS